MPVAWYPPSTIRTSAVTARPAAESRNIAAQRRAVAIDLENARESGDARRRQRLDGTGGDGVDANRPWSQISREIADGRLERGLGHPHDVVVLEDTLAAQVRQREDTATTAAFQQRSSAACERDERIRAHVHRQPEAFSRRLDKRRHQLLARRERGPVHDEIKPAELPIDRLEHVVDLGIHRHVARQDQRILQRCREVADVFFEPLSLIRHGEPGARG
jgi:hypothetical protein